MTDAEIIKAVESRMPFDRVCVEAYDLINRQKAEIEKLQKENNLFDDIGKMYSEIKTEAIKEFAERLKIDYGEFVYLGDIDHIVEEMEGDMK